MTTAVTKKVASKESRNKEKVELIPFGQYYGTGRRKEAIAKVWLSPGTGKFIVNDVQIKDYLLRDSLIEIANSPFRATDTVGKYDVRCRVSSGGIAGQAGAIVMGIARALVQVSEELKEKLGQGGMLTRDDRMKERKKYGRKRARKSFQYRKR